MLALTNRLNRELELAENTYEITLLLAKSIWLLPIIASTLYVLSVLNPTTRNLAIWLQEENRPIELLTFGFLLAGGVQGLLLAWHAKTKNEGILVYGFYTIFSIAFVVIAMEEVAWGQWFFGFETPPALKSMNVQEEFTFHNIRGIHGKTEFVRAAYGLGGLIGVWISSRRYFRKIGAPFILLSWFMIISVHAVPDLYVEYFSVEGPLDRLISSLAEFVEMLIAISGFLYIWLNTRMLTLVWKDRVQPDARTN